MFRETSRIYDICPICEEQREILIGVKPETFTIARDSIELESKVYRCTSCNEFFADTDTEEENFQKAYRKYRHNHGLLQPEDIKAIREKYGISQRAFGIILGWGAITLHRYESGALQDEAHNNDLLFVRDPTNFLLLFQKNKDKLPPLVVKRLQVRLTELLQEKWKTNFKKYFECYFNEATKSIESGFRMFDLDRFENMILHFARREHGVPKAKLNKLLWYSDFLHFKTSGVSISGAIYSHQHSGPVPKHFDFYAAKLAEEGCLFLNEIIHPSGHSSEEYQASEEPDTRIFTPEQIDCLNYTLEFFKDFDSKQMFEYAEKEPGFTKTKIGEVISYDLSQLLKIPFP